MVSADELIARTSSILDALQSKIGYKDEKVINRGKRSKALSEVIPIKIIHKNLQGFLEISNVQKEVLPSPKLQLHAYE